MFAGITAVAVALAVAMGSPAGLAPEPPAASASVSDIGLTTTGSGPASKYDCALSIRPAADAFTGADGTASEIGWEGNQQGVVTCLGGVFSSLRTAFYQNYGFGIYDGAPTTWTDADGYLPAQITSFSRNGARVSITEFADRVVVSVATPLSPSTAGSR